MISEIWRIIKTLVTFADDLQEYHSEIKEIRQDLRDLTIIVHALAQDNKNTKEQLSLEHKNLLLEVEKRLESINKQLPPGKRRPRKKK